MDSPHLWRLCFLLLTIAAPRATIAVPRGSPTGMTQDSSSGKMHVIVYYCKDCEVSICEENDYGGFDKIVDTENETISDKKIKLEINEKNISMCFQQENTSYKGIYGIWWQKKMGMGDACGIVDYGASSENGSGNIIKICCAVDTNHENTKHSMECYTSDEEPPTRKSGVSISDEEDPGVAQPLMGVDDSTGVIAAILIPGVCAAALITFCVRRNRNGQGPVMLIQQFFDAAGGKNLVPDIEDLASFGQKSSK
ncbi:PREDICTED: uncharacterized protein LOC106892438 [Calidris pugnax]|uniref:uncharacterized protein LOC106892438 n=1 Tax=Calidris pugnax TaxID=198806 RepID=UPI00071E2001|nr:PREDICTED: uncharacterized protein LOC106892438 [Calidris pugnax]XP_014805141.1 PREDICTED: uncharacterized protein LOC106892438 [Calidris pugnax]